jgi:hypothetical protein
MEGEERLLPDGFDEAALDRCRELFLLRSKGPIA